MKARETFSRTEAHPSQAVTAASRRVSAPKEFDALSGEDQYCQIQLQYGIIPDMNHGHNHAHAAMNLTTYT